MSKKSKKAKKSEKAKKSKKAQERWCPDATSFLARYGTPHRRDADWVTAEEDPSRPPCSTLPFDALTASTCSPATYKLLQNATIADFIRHEPDPYPPESWHFRTAWALIAFVVVSVISSLLMTHWG